MSGSTTQPSLPVQHNTQSMMGAFDMNHMFQMYSAGIMMRMMNTVNDNTGGFFTYDKIIALIVLFLMNDIKKWVIEFIEFLKKQIVENVPVIVQKVSAGGIAYYYTWSAYVWHMVVRKPIHKEYLAAFNEADDIECEAQPTKTTMAVEIEINTFNMNALWQYIQMIPEERVKLGAKVPDGVQTSTMSTASTAIISKENITTNLTYDNIVVQITPDLKMGMQYISMSVNNITGALVGASINTEQSIKESVQFDIENNEIFKTIDMVNYQFTDPYNNSNIYIKEYIKSIFTKINNLKLSFEKLKEMLYENTILDHFIFKKYAIHQLEANYKPQNIDAYPNCLCSSLFMLAYIYEKQYNITTYTHRIKILEMYLCIYIIGQIWGHFGGLRYSIKKHDNNSIKIYISNRDNSPHFIIPISSTNAFLKKLNNVTIGTTEILMNNTIYKNIDKFLRYVYHTPLTMTTTAPLKTNIELTTTDLNKTHQVMYDEFLQFYRTVILKAPEVSKSAQFSKTSNITVYAISYKKTEEVKTVENPDYTEWMEMFGGTTKSAAPQVAVEESSPKSAPPPAMHQSYEMIAKMEAYRIKPPKTIEIRAQKTELICEKVNQLYKNMESLYLREEDKRKITSIVHKFKTRQDFYEQLGIPYKLGIMLYGHPGTGKSSTIKAIASTLVKDIYFVNLKNVRTNAELKGIFEHINEKCNGGVIVFEDMDASCDVIKRRISTDNVETRPDSVADLTDHVADDKLTLSYLLNLLDGTICRDGTIFAITTNHIENIDPALYRAGRVDVKIEFRKCDHYQIAQIFRHIIGRELAANVLAMIPEWQYSPADIIYEIMHYGLDDAATDHEIMRTFIKG